MSASLESGRISLNQAAAILGCHVETLRLRVRRGRLSATRGPHGKYYVTRTDLERLWPPIRFRKRRFDLEQLREESRQILEELLANRAVIRPHQLQLIDRVRADPTHDVHLHRLLEVHSLLISGLSTCEIADQVGISSRQVRRLKRLNLYAGAQAALERVAKAERGRARRAAVPIVREIQRRLAEAGFRPARRHPKSEVSGARGGQPARVVLVRNLDRATKSHLRANGLTAEQLEAISLVGLGLDELNELILRGLPEDAPQA
jgi:hypothetical protein